MKSHKAVPDLHKQILDAYPSRSKFLNFHAVFGKCWLNNRLAPLPPLWGWRLDLVNHEFATAKYDVLIESCDLLIESCISRRKGDLKSQVATAVWHLIHDFQNI